VPAAQPAYLQDFADAAPGHHFGLYYAGWNADFSKPKTGASGTLRSTVCKLPKHSRDLLAALAERQNAEALALAAPIFTYPAIASAPFATGLGNEHPLENGFSFLTPYGLPYLPGSGVKGVIRKAAEELASGEWGDAQGWNAAAIRNLFGPGEEDDTRDSAPQQGALRFWDVIPTPPAALKNDKALLIVEIMTPHHSGYYQEGDQIGKTPNTSESPNPISFLAVSAEARFTFYVECHPARLDADLQGDWQTLIEAAFTHAGKWLGFGAKTAVGYGRMRPDQDACEKMREKQEKEAAVQRQKDEEAQRAADLNKLSPLERSIAEVLAAKPKDQPELKALFNHLKNKHWQGEDARQVAQRLQTMMQASGQWREKSEKKKPEKDEPYQMTLAVQAALRLA
jgi:CRISPR-associated protein Cmr6